MVASSLYGITKEGQQVIEYALINARGMEMKVINYGCTITFLKVPDRNGVLENIVLGLNSLEDYIDCKHYLGSIVGRCANRIAHGQFNLNGQQHQLSINDSDHHLHGGINGFDKVVWSAHPFENDRGSGIDFFHLSKHGDQGYPGNVSINVRYFLSHENAVIFTYTAATDQPTIINLTQHAYFNLNSGIENIKGHQLKINAQHFLPVDRTLIPTGELRDVTGSAFDFRQLKVVGKDINADDEQIDLANGYDHCWVLDKNGEVLSFAATLYEQVNGRVMDIHTSEPGIQLYTGNYLRHLTSTNEYTPYDGLCLETQHFPDSPNNALFPDVTLVPGKTYQSTTVWRFSVK